MDCFYINLDSATQRKLKFENNFAAFKKQNWNLSRFSAIDTEFVKTHNIVGTSRPAEKGCFLSHKILIGENLTDDKTIFILEDDAVFGARTCGLIEAALKQNKNLDWDILFTDVCIPHLTTMVELLTYRRELVAKKIEVEFVNLHKKPLAGSTAYLLNGKSKQKFYDLMNSVSSLDIPYDLYLRQWIHTSVLKGFTLFPFVTSLSEFSEMSQIKLSGISQEEIAWNMYRKMIWAERNLENCKSGLKSLKNTLSHKGMEAFRFLLSSSDEELKAFGILFSSMAHTIV
jgi:GR25 family glycosyltransferase involved in LPS biosynthesis